MLLFQLFPQSIVLRSQIGHLLKHLLGFCFGFGKRSSVLIDGLLYVIHYIFTVKAADYGAAKCDISYHM